MWCGAEVGVCSEINTKQIQVRSECQFLSFKRIVARKSKV